MGVYILRSLAKNIEKACTLVKHQGRDFDSLCWETQFESA
jgi:hypothetical protein